MSGKSKKRRTSKLQKSEKKIRYFSEEFKRTKVKSLENRELTVTELSKLYDVSTTSIYRWLHLYSDSFEKGVRKTVQMESEEVKTKKLLARVAELERIVGQKQLEIDCLHQMFDTASEEVGYDLKKKYGIESSNGFGSIKKTGTTK